MKKRVGLTIVFLFILILYGNKTHREKESRDKHNQSLIIPNTPDDGKMYRGYNFKTGTYIEDESYNMQFRPHVYSDAELQELREKMQYDTEGRYFHIPGKRVLTREEEIQEEIDRYIEDNIDDILDEYGGR